LIVITTPAAIGPPVSFGASHQRQFLNRYRMTLNRYRMRKSRVTPFDPFTHL
jgi:hypothetical protein